MYSKQQDELIWFWNWSKQGHGHDYNFSFLIEVYFKEIITNEYQEEQDLLPVSLSNVDGGVLFVDIINTEFTLTKNGFDFNIYIYTVWNACLETSVLIGVIIRILSYESWLGSLSHWLFPLSWDKNI